MVDGTLDEAPATDEETRAALLDRNRRPFTPINKVFVQAPRGSASRLGPLSQFVRGRDLRGLQAFLMILAAISNGGTDQGWSTTLSIQVWARVFGTTRTATGVSASTAASKILTRLENRKLITRERHGRHRNIRITLLREDGSGQPYTRPGSGNNDRFLKLPHAYWRDGWYAQLDLPATAMLLVALHEKPGFQLPTERMPSWYGWSSDTAERGLATLRDLDLLRVDSRLVKAPLSPTGQARVNKYTLIGPFAQPASKPSTKLDTDKITSTEDDRPAPGTRRLPRRRRTTRKTNAA
jgi:hypothetical protein